MASGELASHVVDESRPEDEAINTDVTGCVNSLVNEVMRMRTNEMMELIEKRRQDREREMAQLCQEVRESRPSTSGATKKKNRLEINNPVDSDDDDVQIVEPNSSTTHRYSMRPRPRENRPPPSPEPATPPIVKPVELTPQALEFLKSQGMGSEIIKVMKDGGCSLDLNQLIKMGCKVVGPGLNAKAVNLKLMPMPMAAARMAEASKPQIDPSTIKRTYALKPRPVTNPTDKPIIMCTTGGSYEPASNQLVDCVEAPECNTSLELPQGVENKNEVSLPAPPMKTYSKPKIAISEMQRKPLVMTPPPPPPKPTRSLLQKTPQQPRTYQTYGRLNTPSKPLNTPISTATQSRPSYSGFVQPRVPKPVAQSPQTQKPQTVNQFNVLPQDQPRLTIDPDDYFPNNFFSLRPCDQAKFKGPSRSLKCTFTFCKCLNIENPSNPKHKMFRDDERYDTQWLNFIQRYDPWRGRNKNRKPQICSCHFKNHQPCATPELKAFEYQTIINRLRAENEQLMKEVTNITDKVKTVFRKDQIERIMHDRKRCMAKTPWTHGTVKTALKVRKLVKTSVYQKIVKTLNIPLPTATYITGYVSLFQDQLEQKENPSSIATHNPSKTTIEVVKDDSAENEIDEAINAITSEVLKTKESVNGEDADEEGDGKEKKRSWKLNRKIVASLSEEEINEFKKLIEEFEKEKKVRASEHGQLQNHKIQARQRERKSKPGNPRPQTSAEGGENSRKRKPKATTSNQGESSDQQPKKKRIRKKKDPQPSQADEQQPHQVPQHNYPHQHQQHRFEPINFDFLVQSMYHT